MSTVDELRKRVAGERITAVHALAQLVTLLQSKADTADELQVETTAGEHAQILRAAYYWLQSCEALGYPAALTAKLDSVIDLACQLPIVQDSANASVTRVR